MENENLRNIENLLAAKASTQPLYEFPVDQLPLGLRDSLSGVAAADTLSSYSIGYDMV